PIKGTMSVLNSAFSTNSYAYVNPVVAVVLGYLLGGEALGLRTILGTAFVLISVLAITMTPAQPLNVPNFAASRD
ncbi:MAG: hypothetical protein ACYC6M_08165, partial [Terriglobales bacterium]